MAGALAAVSAAPAAPAAENPLVPSAAELITGIVAFAVLYYVIAKFVAPRFEQVYRERSEAIEGGIAKAEQAQRQAQEALEKYQAQLADARGEAARIREDAREQGTAIIAEMREHAQTESARITAAAQQQIEAEKQAALLTLRAEVGSIAADLAGRIVGEALDDDERQRRVVDAFLADLESSTGSNR